MFLATDGSWHDSVQEIIVERIDKQLWRQLTGSTRRSNLGRVADAVEDPDSALRHALEAGSLGEESFLDWLLAQFILGLLLPGAGQFTQLATTLRLLDLFMQPRRSQQLGLRLATAALAEQFEDEPADQLITIAMAQLEFVP